MNKFDQLSGLAEYDESLGFLKKLRKKVKKVVKKAAMPVTAVIKKPISSIGKPVTNIHKKVFTGLVTSPLKKVGAPVSRKLIDVNKTVVKKLVVNPIQHTAKKASPIAANPLVQQVALGVAIGAGAGPLAVAGMQMAGKLASSNEAGKLAKKEQALVNKQIAEATKEVADAEYINAVNQMRSDGMTENQIASEWMQSQTYKDAAIPAVAQTLTPIYQAQYRAAGVQNYNEVGEAVAASDAIAVVDKVQSDFKVEKMIVPAAALLALVFLMKK